MNTYRFQYNDDDSGELKSFLCDASSYQDAVDMLLTSYPNTYYYELQDGDISCQY